MGARARFDHRRRMHLERGHADRRGQRNPNARFCPKTPPTPPGRAASAPRRLALRFLPFFPVPRAGAPGAAGFVRDRSALAAALAPPVVAARPSLFLLGKGTRLDGRPLPGTRNGSPRWPLPVGAAVTDASERAPPLALRPRRRRQWAPAMAEGLSRPAQTEGARPSLGALRRPNPELREVPGASGNPAEFLSPKPREPSPRPKRNDLPLTSVAYRRGGGVVPREHVLPPPPWKARP